MLRWLKSDAFNVVCEACGEDWDRVMSTFEFLGRYDFPLRKNMMKETVAATLGGTRFKDDRAGED